MALAGPALALAACAATDRVSSSSADAAEPVGPRSATSARPAPHARCPIGPWPLFDAYARAFVGAAPGADGLAGVAPGRVVDPTGGGRSTSEGQAYGLFFALVANDRPRFDAILEWTRVHLFEGDLGRGLPAWLYGQDESGAWRVLDANAATDADLWMAYALLEAGRLWAAPPLDALGRSLVARVVERSMATLPGLGPTILPGPEGFVLRPGERWRLNPSYIVLVQYLRFGALGLEGDWEGALASAARTLEASAPRGFAPDWVVYDAEQGFIDDTERPPAASYDAIRVPLFAAFLPPGDPLGRLLREPLHGWIDHFARHRRVEERIDPRAPAPTPREGPPGFLAALVPNALHVGREDLATALLARIEAARQGDLLGAPPVYYDQNLAMFGLGFAEGRFRFGPEGELSTPWSDPTCTPAPTR